MIQDQQREGTDRRSCGMKAAYGFFLGIMKAFLKILPFKIVIKDMKLNNNMKVIN